jgi:RNA recognition motif-containing protein
MSMFNICSQPSPRHPLHCALLRADYFTQFGKVNKVRLSRSKKSGRSRGYAFLEFQSAEVAKIAAEAMDGYLFFGQKLVSRLLKAEEVHEELFKGANRVFKQVRAPAAEMGPRPARRP